MWRGVVLHFLARREGVFPSPHWCCTQPRLPHPSGQGAVGDGLIVFGGEQLGDAHHVALGALERICLQHFRVKPCQL